MLHALELDVWMVWMQGDWDQRRAQDESSVSKWVCGINAFLFSDFTEFTGPTGPTVRGEAPIESYRKPLGQPWRHGGRGDWRWFDI